jgi:hypothetical protein
MDGRKEDSEERKQGLDGRKEGGKEGRKEAFFPVVPSVGEERVQ